MSYNSKKSAIIRTSVSVALFLFVFGGLVALASVYDLQVSKMLVALAPGEYLTTNPFGVLFECIGSWPVYAFMSVAFAVFFSNAKRSDNKWVKYLLSTVSNILSIVAMYILVTDTVNYLEQHFDVEHFTETTFATVVFIMIAAALGELGCFAFSKVDDKTAKALMKFAFVIIFAVALSNIVVNLIKNYMYRPRYRTMNFLGDDRFSDFFNWYEKAGEPHISYRLMQINVGKDAYRSFPSGHTCAAGTVYSLLALPYLLKKYDTRKAKIGLCVLAVAITGIVAVSRIVCGAHFFSDVLFGGTISFLSVMLGIKIFIRKDFKKA